MKYIAHRGNTNGPSQYENRPEYLLKAAKTFDVELDVWNVNGRYWLGHDKPQYAVDLGFLVNDKFWCHAKDSQTFADLAQHSKIHAFFQESDDVAFTTQGYLWHHSSAPWQGPRSVVTALEKSVPLQNVYATCSDWCEGGGVVQPIFPKLILLDVDGVMTDGTKIYNRDHQVVNKNFCDRDYTAIKRFQSAGISVALISGDLFNRTMAALRGIPFYWTYEDGAKDKKERLEAICEINNIQPRDILYVGDDYYDLMLLESVGQAYCPMDAIADVKMVAKEVLEYGGHGVVAALFDSIRHLIPQVYPEDSQEVNPR